MSKRSYFIASVEVLLVIVDINPLFGEPLRYGVLFGVQATLHNALVAGLAFGVITLLLDGAGAIAMADLLSTKQASTRLAKINSYIAAHNLQKYLDIKTGFLGDIGITLLVSTPVTILVKQRQNPHRSRRQNLNYGIVLSAIAAPAAVVQGGAITAGLWHPSNVTIGIAIAVVLTFIIARHIIKLRLDALSGTNKTS